MNGVQSAEERRVGAKRPNEGRTSSRKTAAGALLELARSLEAGNPRLESLRPRIQRSEVTKAENMGEPAGLAHAEL